MRILDQRQHPLAFPNARHLSDRNTLAAHAGSDGRPSFWMLAAPSRVFTVSVIDYLAESKWTSLASQGQTAHRVQ
eukprot:5729705-Prymnesium_polylepis.1